MWHKFYARAMWHWCVLLVVARASKKRFGKFGSEPFFVPNLLKLLVMYVRESFFFFSFFLNEIEIVIKVPVKNNKERGKIILWSSILIAFPDGIDTKDASIKWKQHPLYVRFEGASIPETFALCRKTKERVTWIDKKR